MILRSLKLKNYRRFSDCELEFPEGIIGMLGNNGAGKSTIVEAIAWTLFGNNASRSGKDEIKFTEAPPGEECMAELDFEMDGEYFKVVRILKGVSNTGDASMFSGKRLLAKTTKVVNAEVEKLLGMDLRNFRISFFARQKELNALSELKPAERRAHIIKLLGISDIDEAIKFIREDKRKDEAQVEANQRMINSISSSEDAINKEEEGLRELNGRIEKGEKVTAERKSSYEISLSEFRNISQLKEKHSKTQHECDNIDIKIKNEEKQLDRLKAKAKSLNEYNNKISVIEPQIQNFDELKSRLENLNEEALVYFKIQQMRNDRDKLCSERTRSEEYIQTMQNDLTSENAILSSLEEKVIIRNNLIEKTSENIKEQSRLNSEMNLNSSRLSELSTQMANIEELGSDSVCDRCLRPMGDDYESIRTHLQNEIDGYDENNDRLKPELIRAKNTGLELENEKKDVERKIRELQNKIAGFQQLKKSFNRENDALKSILQRIEEFAGKIERHKKSDYDSGIHNELKDKFKRLSVLRDEYINLNATVKSLEDVASRLSESGELISQLKDDRNKLKKKLSTIDYSDDKYSEIEKMKDEALSQYHKAELTLKDLISDLRLRKQEIERLKSELQKKTLLEEENTDIRMKTGTLGQLESLFNKFREDLISRIRPALSRYSSEYLDVLTDGKYTEMEIREGYSIYIDDSGEKYEIERFSGGEKDIANLCLRLAISELTSESRDVNFSFVVLDEIFGSLDDKRREAVMNALGNLRKRFRQIFVITHLDDIKERLESILYVRELSDGSSSASFL
ncbi:MAG: SMC family ATPase [candidate division Zixibacteria bacterium]|nr:SMC family ATPase [candidate division Zixibacteria bacterium]